MTSDDERRRILIITLGAMTGTSSHLFDELSRFLGQDHTCRNIWIGLPETSVFGRVLAVIASNFRHLRDLPWAEVIMVHAPSSLSLPLLVTARILGKKLVVFQWDVYPISIDGVPYRKTLARRLLYWLEGLCLKLADVIVVPSEDFRDFTTAYDPVVFPLWPQATLQSLAVHRVPSLDGDFHIAFAGEINELRGLQECCAHLQAWSQTRTVLHLFSDNPLGWEPEVNDVLRIEHHGRLPRELLQARLQQMHFGLISLHPLLDQPGFPSKTFDYLAAGLPVLYFGRLLPAFTDELEKRGVGVDINKDEEINLKDLYEDRISRLEEGRADYLAFTQLSRERLEPLLVPPNTKQRALRRRT